MCFITLPFHGAHLLEEKVGGSVPILTTNPLCFLASFSSTFSFPCLLLYLLLVYLPPSLPSCFLASFSTFSLFPCLLLYLILVLLPFVCRHHFARSVNSGVSVCWCVLFTLRSVDPRMDHMTLFCSVHNVPLFCMSCKQPKLVSFWPKFTSVDPKQIIIMTSSV